jgi:hypothetical protein
MNKSQCGGFGSTQRRKTSRADGESQFLLIMEEQLLQAISARAPLGKVLEGICSALDGQIADVVSLISLPGDDHCTFSAIAGKAAFFGLTSFCSEDVVAEKEEVLGSLEMYCGDPRKPSASEYQLIERAMCLAAVAIKLHNEANPRGNCATAENRTEPEAHSTGYRLRTSCPMAH